MKNNHKEQRSLFPEECLLRERARHPRLSIGIPKENPAIETRLALTPEGVAIVTEEPLYAFRFLLAIRAPLYRILSVVDVLRPFLIKMMQIGMTYNISAYLYLIPYKYFL
jgi:hypothetical protein